MSKKHSKLQRDAKIAKRRAIKKANQERHQDMLGKKKSKVENKKVPNKKHPFGKCGNIGCKKCNPPLNEQVVYQHAPLSPKDKYLRRIKNTFK